MFDKHSGKLLRVAALLVIVITIISFSACDMVQPKKTAPAPAPKTTPAPAPAPQKAVVYPVEGTVSDVVDNNIIKIKDGAKEYTVRYIGIYTLVPYEHSKPISYYADEGYKKNFELVNGKKVRLEKDVSETDKAGNLLRYVWIGEVMVNAELVKQGYAMVLGSPPDVKYADKLYSLQQEAQREGRGLWQEETKQTPLTPLLGEFVGNTVTKTYHFTFCNLVSRIKEENRISFMTANTALARGYKSCPVCKTPSNVCEQRSGDD